MDVPGHVGMHVVHFRCRSAAKEGERAKVLTNGGITVAVCRNGGVLQAAYSVCSASDSFNPVSGVKRAVARLLSTPHYGRRNTKIERYSDPHFTSPPMLADAYPMGAGFDYIAELADAGCVLELVVFAWAVAVHAVLTMKGGSLADQETLRQTLSAVPRGVKVKPLPKKDEEKPA